jgi:hypothetical protein
MCVFLTNKEIVVIIIIIIYFIYIPLAVHRNTKFLPVHIH